MRDPAEIIDAAIRAELTRQAEASRACGLFVDLDYVSAEPRAMVDGYVDIPQLVAAIAKALT